MLSPTFPIIQQLASFPSDPCCLLKCSRLSKSFTIDLTRKLTFVYKYLYLGKSLIEIKISNLRVT